MNRILLYTNLMKDPKIEKTTEIAEKLLDMGYTVFIMVKEDTLDLEFNNRSRIPIIKNREEIEKEQIELVIIVGGDGSIIGFARTYRDIDVPIIGLNIGTLGFLPELSLQNYERIFANLRDGKIDYNIAERTGLYVEFEDELDERLFAVNEVAVARGLQARIIDVEVYVNGVYLDTYNADGIIVATATGSTGYSLSAGGPILLPSSSDVVITPVCPHSLASRSIVVTKDDIITLKMVSLNRGNQTRAQMTIDGQETYPVKSDSTINIKTRNKKLKYLTFDDEIFYRRLREKIK